MAWDLGSMMKRPWVYVELYFRKFWKLNSKVKSRNDSSWDTHGERLSLHQKILNFQKGQQLWKANSTQSDRKKKPLVNSLPGPLDSYLLSDKKVKRSVFIPKGKVKESDSLVHKRDCKSSSEIRNAGPDKNKNSSSLCSVSPVMALYFLFISKLSCIISHLPQ